MRVEKWLLLDGIALHASGISEWNVKLSATIKTDFADSGLTLRNRAAVAAGKAADSLVPEVFHERGFSLTNLLFENSTESGHSVNSIVTLVSS